MDYACDTAGRLLSLDRQTNPGQYFREYTRDKVGDRLSVIDSEAASRTCSLACRGVLWSTKYPGDAARDHRANNREFTCAVAAHLATDAPERLGRCCGGGRGDAAGVWRGR